MLPINLLSSKIDHLGSQLIEIDIGKSFDKSISIDKLIINNIDFIGQSIKINTHNADKVLILSILSHSTIVIELSCFH